jgi:hypothetical protein
MIFFIGFSVKVRVSYLRLKKIVAGCGNQLLDIKRRVGYGFVPGRESWL